MVDIGCFGGQDGQIVVDRSRLGCDCRHCESCGYWVLVTLFQKKGPFLIYLLTTVLTNTLAPGFGASHGLET
jgi:hypothetical protein